MDKGEVVLFKSISEEEEDKFEVALRNAQFSPTVIPVISFSYSNLESLREALGNGALYRGIIFSSPRCVWSVEKALGEGNRAVLDSWGQSWMFCVGKATAHEARKLFTSHSVEKLLTSPEENAESMGKQILEKMRNLREEDSNNFPPIFLYPCGSLKRDTLNDILSSGNVKTDPIVVYETIEHPKLKERIQSLTERLDQDTAPFTFFSPSGLNFMWKYGKDLILGNKKRPLIALGPTTKEALVKHGLENIHQCETPSPEGLLKCLETLES